MLPQKLLARPPARRCGYFRRDFQDVSLHVGVVAILSADRPACSDRSAAACTMVLSLRKAQNIPAIEDVFVSFLSFFFFDLGWLLKHSSFPTFASIWILGAGVPAGGLASTNPVS